MAGFRGIVLFLTAAVWPSLLAAQEAAAESEHASSPSAMSPAGAFEVPPAVESLEPVLSGALYLGFSLPLENGALCPSAAECVYSNGGGVGGHVERRWPSGPAVGLAYELGFVNSNGVFELGLIQELRGQAKYYFLPRSLVHPFVGGGVGAVIFGDTFRVATAGVSVTAIVGLELELTELLSAFVTLPVRAIRFAPFTAGRDGVRRAADGDFSVTAALQLGLVITQIP